MNSKRDPFKAGLFVLAGIVLCLVVVALLSDFSRWTTPQQKIQVAVQLEEGLRGLKPGSMVSLGSQPVGVVTAVGDHIENDRVVAKTATISLPKKYVIASDASFELVVPTLGSDTSLNITSVGQGQPYKPGQMIPVALAPNPITSQLARELGFGPTQRQQLQDVIANIEQASDSLKETLPETAAQLSAIAAKIGPLVDKASPAVDDAAASIAHVKSMAARFDARTPAWAKQVDDITARSQESVTLVRDLLKDKDPQLRAITDDVAAITRHTREKTLLAVDEAIGKGTAAIENLRISSQDIRSMIVGQRPVIERALANAQLTTDQLKLAAIEIRRSPWRLMYKPDDKELETDNLYDAARSFALAAGTLDAAASSLKAVANDRAENPQQVQRVLDHLTAVFGEYEIAEKAFWDALKDQRPGE